MKAKEQVRPLTAVECLGKNADEAGVIAYLKAHPDFFLAHQDLLGELQVPHGSGAAVSLVERQVTLLRERNIEMRHRLGRIVETARHNDRLFEKTRGLVLQLLRHDSVESMVDCAREHLMRELGADFCVVRLFTAGTREGAPDADPAKAVLGPVLLQTPAHCGPLRESERQCLFGVDADAVESAALVPLRQDGRLRGVLAVGSSDAAHFSRDMGTLFLDFVADVIAHRLPAPAES